MTICIILILLIVLGILLCCLEEYNTYIVGVILIFICTVSLIVAISEKVNNHFIIHAEINKFVTTKMTIKFARNNKINLENAAIQHKIIESNQWLAEKQYYNTTIWSWWIPDEIANLKPIK